MLIIKDMGKRKPYNYKEIVELDYPDIWNAANESVRRAYIIQQMMVKMLPTFHGKVPADAEMQQSEKAIKLLENYLKLRSFYCFGHYIWEVANRLCHELAESSNEGDYNGVDKAKTDLVALFETIDKVDVTDIVQDQETGFEKLKQALGRIDFFPVLEGYTSKGSHTSWSFQDIVGTLQNGGPTDRLWACALNCPVPTEPDVAGLMESEEDNIIVRMY